jgi:NitT/TauT family transport system ATP-binding protein
MSSFAAHSQRLSRSWLRAQLPGRRAATPRDHSASTVAIDKAQPGQQVAPFSTTDPVPMPGSAYEAPFAVRAAAVERSFVSRRSNVHALGPVDLTVAAGQFVCIVGPSGCGKSTLLRIVAGLVRPSEGTVEVRSGSEPVPSIATVFQNYGIFPWKTVQENIRFGLDIRGMSRDAANARARDWLARLGLEQFGKHYPGTLSGGMQQRVAIARALAVEPELLLMDEPFAALDAQLRHVMQDELLALWQSDRRTVLFVTHSLEEALILGDRVLVMSARPGRILADIDVPFPRPRAGEVRSDPQFGELIGQLWQLLRGEVAQPVAAGTGNQPS